MASKAFLEQTARDYALPLHIVESIYHKFGDNGFYEALEAELKRRAYIFKRP